MSPGTDRGVSITLSYMLTLGIASLLVMGLLGGYYLILGSSSNSVSYYDLRSSSGMLVLSMDQFQRLIRTGMSVGMVEYAEYAPMLPASAAGQSYIVELVKDRDQFYVLKFSTRELTYEIPLRLKLNGTNSSSSSIGIRLIYQNSSLSLR